MPLKDEIERTDTEVILRCRECKEETRIPIEIYERKVR